MIKNINSTDISVFHLTNEILLAEIKYNPQQFPVPNFILKCFKQPSKNDKYDITPFSLKESKQINRFITEHHYFPYSSSVKQL